MKTNRQAQREAKRLFRLCVVDGSLDEGRVRQVVDGVIDAGRPGGLKILSRFQRLVRLRREAHSAKVESASPLSSDVQTQIESELARMYGRGLLMSYASNPRLLGGVRITVGSDVYDGSVRGRLTALEERF
jgi:F-type H+-transporting ATPase subunit delta